MTNILRALINLTDHFDPYVIWRTTQWGLQLFTLHICHFTDLILNLKILSSVYLGWVHVVSVCVWALWVWTGSTSSLSPMCLQWVWAGSSLSLSLMCLQWVWAESKVDPTKTYCRYIMFRPSLNLSRPTRDEMDPA